MPKHLADLMLRLSIEERDPSKNRFFIEPAVKALGARKVISRLIKVLRSGSDVEKGGAASAAYWVRGDADQPSYREVRAKFDDELMRQFVATESTYVQQRIVPMLSMDSTDYSPDIAALIPTAIHIGRAHPDPYIRHRIEIQLGAGGPFQALPVLETGSGSSLVSRLLGRFGLDFPAR